MSIVRSLSTSRVRAYSDCPRLYRLQYIDHYVAPGPRPTPLLLGDMIHRILARLHQEHPQNNAGLLECVDEVFAGARAEFDAEELDTVRAEAAAYALEYFHHAAHVIGPECECEVWLSAQVGPLNLASRADAVWASGDLVTEVDWKLSLPAPNARYLQTTFLHAGLRRRFPEARIRHLMIALRPDVAVHEVPLDEPIYRRMLGHILDVSRQLAREQKWEPTPGPACRYCSYAGVCDAVSATIASTPF